MVAWIFAIIFTLIFAFIGLILLIVFLFFYGKGLSSVARKYNVPNEIFAFIPILQFFTLGSIVREVKVAEYSIPYPQYFLALGTLVALLLSQVPIIGWVLFLAAYALKLIYHYELFKKFYDQDIAMKYTLISIIPLAIAFFVYRLKDIEPKY